METGNASVVAPTTKRYGIEPWLAFENKKLGAAELLPLLTPAEIATDESGADGVPPADPIPMTQEEISREK